MKKLIFSIIMVATAMNAVAQEMIRVGNDMFEVSKLKSFSYGVSSTQLPDVIENDSRVQLFSQALRCTHISDSLYAYSDLDYGFESKQAKLDSCYWTNDRLCIHTVTEYDNVAYPTTRRYGFTVFTVPDDVLAEKYQVRTLDDLRKLAHEVYDQVYPEDAGVSDETDRRNALNRFVSYHILPFSANYYQLTAYDGDKLVNNFNRSMIDIAEWYETLMPNSLMKFSFPSGSEEGLYINRRGVQNRADYRNVFVRGAKVDGNPIIARTGETPSLNGYYYYIDDIATYGKNTQEVVLDERIRIHSTSLSPDFMQNSLRATGYSYPGQSHSAARNRSYARGFKKDFVRNFEFNDGIWNVHVRPRCLNFWHYNADALLVQGYGSMDMSIKLPSLPAGKYEIRIGQPLGFNATGVWDFYVDGNLLCQNRDFRQYGNKYGIYGLNQVKGGYEKYQEKCQSTIEELSQYLKDGEISEEEYDKEWSDAVENFMNSMEREFGFRPNYDNKTYIYVYDEVSGTGEYVHTYDVAYDYMQHLRKKGWIFGPACYEPGDRNAYANAYSFADLAIMARCVIGTFETDGKSTHTLRMKRANQGFEGELILDYIELVPSTVYESEYGEDIY